MSRKTRGKTRGKTHGGHIALPPSYFGGELPRSVDSSSDVLVARGNVVRPTIGGKRRKTYRKRTNGGFYPSVMGNFVQATSKYIVPMALYAAFKLINKTKKSKGSQRRTRRHQ